MVPGKVRDRWIRLRDGVDRRALLSLDPFATRATVGLLIGCLMLGRLLYPVSQLNEGDYRALSITIASLARPAGLLVTAAGLLAWMRWDLRWQQLWNGALLRFLLLATAGTLVAGFALYEPNWFYGQAHLLDRGLLVALFLASFWRPVLLLPFVVLTTVVASQFNLPLGGYTWNDKRLVFDVLLLSSAALVTGLPKRKEGAQGLLMAVLTLVASWYVVAGVGKLTVGWLGTERLDHLTRSAHVNGWLSADVALQLARWIESWNPILVPATIAFQVSALMLLASRRLACAVLLALQGLHLVVFLGSGIFFWKWMVVEAALFIVLARSPELGHVLRPAAVLVALPFIALSPRWFAVPALAWLDTPYTVTYELEGEGSDGTPCRVDRGDLAPYDVIFAQNRFGALTEEAIPVGTFGSITDAALAGRLMDARSAAEVLAVPGTSRMDDGWSRAFDRLVRARFSGRVRRLPVSAPHHIWTSRSANEPSCVDEAVGVIRVRMSKVWWDGAQFTTIDSRIVRTVAVERRGRRVTRAGS